MSGLFLWIVQTLLWTCHSTAYSLSSLTLIVPHIYVIGRPFDSPHLMANSS